MRLSSRGALAGALAVVVLLLATLVWGVIRAETGPESSSSPAAESEDATASGPSVGQHHEDESSAELQQDQHSPGGAEPELGTDGHEDTAEQEDEGTPEPQRPSGAQALLDNPLYDTERLAPRPCPLPHVDVDEPDSMEDFLDAVADCLDEVWTTQFDRADIPFEPPNRVFWSEPGTSPCRDYPSAAGAFYCRSSTGVYIGTSDVVEKWQGETNGVVYASLLAHEYAHHVQSEAGLLEYYHEQRSEEEDDAERNEWTRRSELQANCLAGAFLGSIAVSYPLGDTDVEILLEDARATADRENEEDDDRTHGTPDNSEHWTYAGYTEQHPGACNTWTAEAEQVQ